MEDANDRRIAPSNLRAPPKHLASTHHSSWSRSGRTVSVIRHGIDWLRRLLLRGRLWNRVWLARTLAGTQAQPGAMPRHKNPIQAPLSAHREWNSLPSAAAITYHAA